jgi:hypothetical protein
MVRYVDLVAEHQQGAAAMVKAAAPLAATTLGSVGAVSSKARNARHTAFLGQVSSSFFRVVARANEVIE